MRTHLLVENRLSLTTIAWLLPVVTALSLCEQRVLALLVLSHFMWSKPIVRSSNLPIVNIMQAYVCFLHVLPLQSARWFRLTRFGFQIEMCSQVLRVLMYKSNQCMLHWIISKITHLGMLTILLQRRRRLSLLTVLISYPLRILPGKGPVQFHNLEFGRVNLFM